MREIRCPRCKQIFWYAGDKERTVCPYVNCCVVIHFDSNGRVVGADDPPKNGRNNRKKKV